MRARPKVTVTVNEKTTDRASIHELTEALQRISRKIDRTELELDIMSHVVLNTNQRKVKRAKPSPADPAASLCRAFEVHTRPQKDDNRARVLRISQYLERLDVVAEPNLPAAFLPDSLSEIFGQLMSEWNMAYRGLYVSILGLPDTGAVPHTNHTEKQFLVALGDWATCLGHWLDYVNLHCEQLEPIGYQNLRHTVVAGLAGLLIWAEQIAVARLWHSLKNPEDYGETAKFDEVLAGDPTLAWVDVLQRHGGVAYLHALAQHLRHKE
ncbi:hypothetical protein IWQ60_011548, partial [Tieghemiomyces parasiticus]